MFCTSTTMQSGVLGNKELDRLYNMRSSICRHQFACIKLESVPSGSGSTQEHRRCGSEIA